MRAPREIPSPSPPLSPRRWAGLKKREEIRGGGVEGGRGRRWGGGGGGRGIAVRGRALVLLAGGRRGAFLRSKTLSVGEHRDMQRGKFGRENLGVLCNFVTLRPLQVRSPTSHPHPPPSL